MGNQLRVDVRAVFEAGCERSLVSVPLGPRTTDGRLSQHLGQCLGRAAAAGPLVAVYRARLPSFGCVDPVEPDLQLADAQAVTIEHLGAAADLSRKGSRAEDKQPDCGTNVQNVDPDGSWNVSRLSGDRYG